ncbi:hypothetical protein GOP47_0016671 [Adiantum capillus-veneris]|uniref:Uncharacterized protein n=1 Tax=Adiantum capillus-veneris TaxID=13818 RepID=A0A9D4UJ44_ADICA|nr:hypothetical protein GOP47_0016671 [Adiantum capillus-veneris]
MKGTVISSTRTSISPTARSNANAVAGLGFSVIRIGSFNTSCSFHGSLKDTCGMAFVGTIGNVGISAAANPSSRTRARGGWKDGEMPHIAPTRMMPSQRSVGWRRCKSSASAPPKDSPT